MSAAERARSSGGEGVDGVEVALVGALTRGSRGEVRRGGAAGAGDRGATVGARGERRDTRRRPARTGRRPLTNARASHRPGKGAYRSGCAAKCFSKHGHALGSDLSDEGSLALDQAYARLIPDDGALTSRVRQGRPWKGPHASKATWVVVDVALLECDRGTSHSCKATCSSERVAPDQREERHPTPCVSLRIGNKSDVPG